ncbi:MAG: putative nicotinate-nucleotide pyrophosphorylase [Candidatus Bathyarchaeota archaeon B63]|nr:MAG: putative nicotinate-nucleotide pyrophosphorylase [Candidatus Bathyarchaeota archaeon B63]
MDTHKPIIREMLMSFLREDLGMGDITTWAVVPADVSVDSQIIVKEEAVIAGLHEASLIFEMAGAKFKARVEEGVEVPAGTIIAEVKGSGRAVLSAERTALNMLMRMTGIATLTRRLINMVREAGLEVRIAATRKTAPGLRFFDKRAVVIGGGDPHRFRLDDAVLIKDNHVRIAGSIKEAIRRARSAVSFAKSIEVEARTVEEALEAAESGVDIIMLDNMSPEEAGRAIRMLEEVGLRDKVMIEISGGVTEDNLLEYARLRPEIISLGFLTHSVRAVDMSLEVVGIHAGSS